MTFPKHRLKVVKVTKTDFELSDGSAYQHNEPLEKVPTIEEFQKIYDQWWEIFKQMGLGDNE